MKIEFIEEIDYMGKTWYSVKVNGLTEKLFTNKEDALNLFESIKKFVDENKSLTKILNTIVYES